MTSAKKSYPIESQNELLATFAGGCFWCMEPPFQSLEGVKKVVSGYTGGHKVNPTYEEVCAGMTGHLEAVQIAFDPKVVSYEKLLQVFWQQIDPTDAEGQFADKGESYKSAIFYHSEEQRKMAELSKSDLAKSGKLNGPIVTAIRESEPFYPAEDYHQSFFKKNPVRYKQYRYSSGRDEFIEKIWGKK